MTELVMQQHTARDAAGELLPAVPAWHPVRPADAPALPAGEVHLWWLSLDCRHPERESLYSLLSDAERAALARIRPAAERLQRAMSQAWRRLVLASYAGDPPAALRFGTARSGKPALLGDAGRLRFSVAHHEHHALIAVANALEVGVDLEAIPAALNGAEHGGWLSPLEAASLEHYPPSERGRAVAAAWVRLEARAKLHGRGLARETDSPAADAPWLLTFTAGADAAAPDLLGALACSARPVRMRWLRPPAD